MSRRALWGLGLLALTVMLAAIPELSLWRDEIFGPTWGSGALRISFPTSTWVSVAGTVIAGALAVALGARRTAIVAMFTVATGIEMAMIGGLYGGSAVAAFGLGLLRPCAMAAAAAIVAEEPLGRLRLHACAAAAFGFAVAADIGSFLGRHLLEDLHGSRVGELALGVYLAAAVPLLVAGRLRGSARDVAPVLDAPYRAPSRPMDEPEAAPPSSWRGLRGALLLVFPVLLLVNVATRFEIRSYDLPASVFVPVLRFLGLAAAAVAFGRAVLRAEPWPPLTVLSGALIALGLALFLTPWSVRDGDSGEAFLFTMVAPTTSLATSLLWNTGSSQVVMSVAPRYATAALGALLVAVMLVAWPLAAALLNAPRSMVLFALSALAMVVGAIVLRRRHDLHRSLFEPEIGPITNP